MIICPSRSTFVRITSVRRPCRVRVTSLPYPCVNLRKDMPRMWHEYDKNNTDAGRTWHGGDTDLIRTFVRVSYFDCLKIIDTDKFGPGDRGGYDTDVIRPWTGRQGHDTDTCPCHVRVSIRVCVNVALARSRHKSAPAKAPVTQDDDHAATMATYGIHQIVVWSLDIRKKTLLCVTAIGTVLRSHGALTRDLCELNCVSTTTSASVRRSYHDLTAPWTRAQRDHRRPYSDATTT